MLLPDNIRGRSKHYIHVMLPIDILVGEALRKYERSKMNDSRRNEDR